MFAAGYSACFIGALKHVAASQKIKLADDISVTGNVAIGPIEQGFAIAVKLTVDLGDMDKAQAQGFIFLATFGIGMLIGTFFNGGLIDANSTTTLVDGIEKTIYDWDKIWMVNTLISVVLLVIFLVLFKDKSKADA